MKKIVGILSASAVLAASVFAADVNAATKIAGNILSYDRNTDESAVGSTTTKEDFTLFKVNNFSHHYDNPNLAFSISDERAGASIKVSSSGAGNALVLCDQSIWFKPFDFLKVTLGNYGLSLNQETIDYGGSKSGINSYGYLVSVNKGKVAVDLGLENGAGADWLTNNKKSTKVNDETTAEDPQTTLKPLYAKVGYTDDFGAIGVYARLNGNGKFDVKEDLNISDLLSLSVKVKHSAPDMTVGVGYKNTFAKTSDNPITMFVNVIGYLDSAKPEQDIPSVTLSVNNMWIRPELFATGTVGEKFGWSAFVGATLDTTYADVSATGMSVKTGRNGLNVDVKAKVTYKLEKITPYAYFSCNAVNTKTFYSGDGAELFSPVTVADKLSSKTKLGATGSVGLMNWDIALQLETANDNTLSGKGSDVKVSVPFTASVSF